MNICNPLALRALRQGENRRFHAAERREIIYRMLALLLGRLVWVNWLSVDWLLFQLFSVIYLATFVCHGSHESSCCWKKKVLKTSSPCGILINACIIQRGQDDILEWLKNQIMCLFLKKKLKKSFEHVVSVGVNTILAAQISRSLRVNLSLTYLFYILGNL